LEYIYGVFGKYFNQIDMNSFYRSHVLSVSQFTTHDIDTIFRLASDLEPIANKKMVTRVLEGAVLGNLFFEPSTRSRISFGAAFSRLGGSVCDTTGFQFSSMAKGESLADTSRVISGYVDMIVMRHPNEGSVAEFSTAATVPVINGGDGPGEHPTQALLDLYTIHKETRLFPHEFTKLTIAMVGDLKFGRTVHSLAKLLSLYKGVSFAFTSPPELGMPPGIVEELKAKGHQVRITNSLEDGLLGADIVYVTRLQQERFSNPDDINKYQGYYRVNAIVLERLCKPNVVLMHPLPRDSRPEANELSTDLNMHKGLAIFRQTDNGIPIRMALFAMALGVEKQVVKEFRPCSWAV
jgi:aspartate carbamoyltransferase catalytic subunit